MLRLSLCHDRRCILAVGHAPFKHRRKVKFSTYLHEMQRDQETAHLEPFPDDAGTEDAGTASAA